MTNDAIKIFCMELGKDAKPTNQPPSMTMQRGSVGDNGSGDGVVCGQTAALKLWPEQHKTCGRASGRHAGRQREGKSSLTQFPVLPGMARCKYALAMPCIGRMSCAEPPQ